MRTAELEPINTIDDLTIKTVDHQINSTRAWIILSCAWAFYLYEYVLRVSPSVMTNSLMLDLGVTSTALGVLVSFYYFAYVPLQIPCGVIVDWVGPRRVVTGSALLCVLGSILFSQSETLLIAQIGRFLIGAGSACAYISCAKIAAEWFKSDKFAIIAGISMMMGTFGGTFGGMPFAILVNQYGWRFSMLLAAIVGMAVALTAWLIIRDKPSSKRDLSEQHKSGESVLAGLKVIAATPQNWLIGLYGCMMYLTLSAFAELWGVPFLMQVYGVSNEIAATGTIMVFLGMAFGSPLGSWYSNYIESRKKVMSLSALGTLCVFSIVFYVPNIPFNIMLGLLFLAGLASGGQILYFAAAKEISPTNASATTVGFINGLVMTSGLIFQPLLGWILDLAWDGKMTFDGTPEYSIYTYQISFSAVVVGLFMSWMIVHFFIRETFKKEA